MKDEIPNAESTLLTGAEERLSENEPRPPRDLKKRLKDYALRVLRLYDSLPKTGAVHIITHQLARSGTSPHAQYREARRAKSTADFVSKVEGALQELDESEGWLELLVDGGYVEHWKLKSLIDETNELIAILVTVTVNAKRRKK
jgi:four helix bundle protein